MLKALVIASGVTLIGAGASFASTVTYVTEATVVALSFEKVEYEYVDGDYDLPPEISPVPLPAAGWMLLAGLGGIVALRRRAKA